MANRIPVECPECGAVIGEMVQIKGMIRLDSGGRLIRDGMRHCYRCGRPFHFKPPITSWEEVCERAFRRVNGGGERSEGNVHNST